MKVNKVVIWGHKLHSHTHSYIHNAFFRTFKYLGYSTVWFDDVDPKIETFDFANCLFITEGQVCTKIPIRDDCYYILHNCGDPKFKAISTSKRLSLQVYTTTCEKYSVKPVPNTTFQFYLPDCVFMPWATDLFPEEVDKNIEKIKREEIVPKVPYVSNFIGMILGDPWEEFSRACKRRGIKFASQGGFTADHKEIEENEKLIQESLIAPALQHTWQIENGYIPCRIFKNISYGKMGITNNVVVNKLFNEELIYDTNMNNIVEKGLEFEKHKENVPRLIKLMEIVRDKHTYVNRINTLLWALKTLIDPTFELDKSK